MYSWHSALFDQQGGGMFEMFDYESYKLSCIFGCFFFLFFFNRVYPASYPLTAGIGSSRPVTNGHVSALNQ